MVELREHQKRVLDQLRTGAVLQGGVGSGKSITALAYYYIYELGGSIEPFTKPTKNVSLCIITTAQKRDKLEWDEECLNLLLSRDRDLSINNIGVTIDSWNNIGKYVDLENTFFIFDEQRLVGSGAWVKAFLKITKKNHWILLSATPGDVWMDYVPVFIANGFYKNRTEFIVKHVIYSRFSKYPKIDRYVNVEELIKNRNSVIVNMLFKHDAEISTEIINVEYDEKLMTRVVKDRWNVFKDRPIRNASELAYTQRRIINSDPSRTRALKKSLIKHPCMIVFYNFDYELDILRDFCRHNDIPYSEWNGHKHEKILSGDKWLYLVQYTSGAEGWNCVTTDTVFLYSQNYSYRITTQAMGRINRLNSPFKILHYIKPISTARLDAAITKALDNKQDFNELSYISSIA